MAKSIGKRTIAQTSEAFSALLANSIRSSFTRLFICLHRPPVSRNWSASCSDCLSVTERLTMYAYTTGWSLKRAVISLLLSEGRIMFTFSLRAPKLFLPQILSNMDSWYRPDCLRGLCLNIFFCSTDFRIFVLFGYMQCELSRFLVSFWAYVLIAYRTVSHDSVLRSRR